MTKYVKEIIMRVQKYECNMQLKNSSTNKQNVKFGSYVIGEKSLNSHEVEILRKNGFSFLSDVLKIVPNEMKEKISKALKLKKGALDIGFNQEETKNITKIKEKEIRPAYWGQKKDWDTAVNESTLEKTVKDYVINANPLPIKETIFL